MPKPQHLKVTAIWSLGGNPGVEEAQFSFNLVNPESGAVAFPGTDAERVAQANDFKGDFQAFAAVGSNGISNTTFLQRVKVASIGADGLYTRDAWESTTVPVAGAAAPSAPLPIQTALVASLDTDRRGPTGRGRVYLPVTGVILGADYRVSGTIIQGIADSFAALVNNINNEPGIDASGMRVCVVSTKGYSTPVTSVRIGRVLDTVRSRRTNLDEDYRVSPTAITG